MNEPIAVTADSFSEQVLRARTPVLVDFWADWCGPCRRLAPVVDEIAAQHTGVRVCKIDVAREPALAERYHVRSVPTVMLFSGGKPLASVTGVHSRETLLHMLKQIEQEEHADERDH